MTAPMREPTHEQFAAYRAMFAHFNRELFGGTLPDVILNFSRHAGAVGFFAPERWKRVAGDSTSHEISLNPSFLGSRSAEETASTLVHEMCHLWQQDFGEPPRRGYHDREWSQKMVSVGLQPVCPRTGQDKMSAPRLTHRIVDAGPFVRAFASLPAEALLPWACAELRISSGGNGSSGGEGDEDEPPAKTRNKVKHTCPTCGANAWGKPSLQLLCADDHEPTPLVVAE